MKRQSTRRQAGQALPELVLIVPALLLIMLGAVDFGQYMHDGIEAANAARAGVQYGAQSMLTAGDVSGITSAVQSDASDISSLSVSATTYCTCDGAPGTQYPCSAMPACGAGDHADLYVQVVVSKTFTPLVAYPGLHNVTVSRVAVQQVTP